MLWSHYQYPCHDVLNVLLDEITGVCSRISRYVVCVAEVIAVFLSMLCRHTRDRLFTFSNCECPTCLLSLNLHLAFCYHPDSARLIHLSDSFEANIRVYSVRGLSLVVASCLFSSDFFVHRGQNVSRKSTPETFWQHRGLIRSRWKMIFPCFRYQQIGYIL